MTFIKPGIAWSTVNGAFVFPTYVAPLSPCALLASAIRSARRAGEASSHHARL